MRRGERTLCLTLLIAVVAWSVINLVVWLRIDTRPPRWDESSYLTLSLKYHEALISGGVGAFVKDLLTLHRERPPLVPALAVPAYLLLGRSTDAAFAVQLLALTVLILAVYALGARLASPWCGLLAALFVSTYPGVLSLSRLFLQDFCEAACVAASLYLLVRTEGLSRKRPSVALGVVLGLGLLCRALFPIFVIGPLGVSAYAAWRASRLNVPAQGTAISRWRINGGLALLACAAVAAPWYLVNIVPLMSRSLSAGYGTLAVGYGPSNPLTLQAMASYFINFVNVHLMLVGLSIFLVAAVILCAKCAALQVEVRAGSGKPAYSLFLLLASILLPYLFFTTMPSQDHKNTLPVLSAIAVLSAWGLTLVRTPILKETLIGLSIAWCLFHYWLGTYGMPVLPQQMRLGVGGSLSQLLLWQQGLQYPAPAFLLPRREHWPLAEILLRVTGGSLGPHNARVMTRPAVVAIPAEHPSFNSVNFEYFSVLHRLPVQVTHPGNPWEPNAQEYRLQLLAADFAVIKVNSQTGEPDPPGVNPANPHYAEMVAFLRSPESGFVEIAPRYPLPDGSQAVLYAVRDGPVMHDLPQMRYPTPVRFGDEVELLGYNCEDKGQTSRGRAFLIIYYWKALREMTYDYHVFVHVTNQADPSMVRGWDHPPARGRYPTSLWQPGTVIEDRGVYFFRKGPSGSYLLRIGLYHPATGERLKVTGAVPGVALDNEETRAAIGTIQVP